VRRRFYSRQRLIAVVRIFVTAAGVAATLLVAWWQISSNRCVPPICDDREGMRRGGGAGVARTTCGIDESL